MKESMGLIVQTGSSLRSVPSTETADLERSALSQGATAAFARRPRVRILEWVLDPLIALYSVLQPVAASIYLARTLSILEDGRTLTIRRDSTVSDWIRVAVPVPSDSDNARGQQRPCSVRSVVRSQSNNQTEPEQTR